MAAGGSKYRELLRQRQVRLLMISFLIDGGASWASSAVLVVVVFDRTGSTGWIAATGAARWIPALILGPFAGLVVDRFERTKVMAMSAALSCVVMAAVASTVGAEGPVWLIVALNGLQGITGSPFEPAVATIIPDVLPEKDLSSANALRELVANLNVVVGPSIGALFLVLHEPAIAIAINAASFLVPMTVALRLGVESAAGEPPTGNPFAQIADGLRALVAQRAALLLTLACALDSFIFGMGSVQFVPISERAGTGSTGYGYLLIGASIGSVAAAGLAGRLAARPHLATVIVASLLVEALPFAAMLIVTVPGTVFVLAVVSGAGMIIVDILAVTALQRDLPREYLGRVFGVFETILLSSVLVANVLGSALQTAFGLTTALLVLGLGASGLSLLMTPALLRVDRRTAATAARIAPFVDLLAALDLFEGADRPALEGLALAATPLTLPAGDTLLREGEPADDLWILTGGTLAVTASGAHGIPDVVAPAYVGELGLLSAGSRTATLVAATQCELMRIPGEQFLSAVQGGDSLPSPLSALSLQRLSRTPNVRVLAQADSD